LAPESEGLGAADGLDEAEALAVDALGAVEVVPELGALEGDELGLPLALPEDEVFEPQAARSSSIRILIEKLWITLFILKTPLWLQIPKCLFGIPRF
jgi:hypothetical protein